MGKEKYLTDILYQGIILVRTLSVNYGLNEEELSREDLLRINRLQGEVVDMLHNLPHIMVDGCNEKRINLEINKIGNIKEFAKGLEGLGYVEQSVKGLETIINNYKEEYC